MCRCFRIRRQHTWSHKRINYVGIDCNRVYSKCTLHNLHLFIFYLFGCWFAPSQINSFVRSNINIFFFIFILLWIEHESTYHLSARLQAQYSSQVDSNDELSASICTQGKCSGKLCVMRKMNSCILKWRILAYCLHSMHNYK